MMMFWGERLVACSGLLGAGAVELVGMGFVVVGGSGRVQLLVFSSVATFCDESLFLFFIC